MTISIQTSGSAAPQSHTASPAVSEDAWTDIAGVRALTCMSASWVHDAVRAKRFPAPVIRGHRCTRWRVGDVLAYMRAQVAAVQSIGSGK